MLASEEAATNNEDEQRVGEIVPRGAYIPGGTGGAVVKGPQDVPPGVMDKIKRGLPLSPDEIKAIMGDGGNVIIADPRPANFESRSMNPYHTQRTGVYPNLPSEGENTTKLVALPVVFSRVGQIYRMFLDSTTEREVRPRASLLT